MIGKVFQFLRDSLNKTLPRDSSDGAAKELFVYVNTDKVDSLGFDADSVSMLLVRVEEETTDRQADPYIRSSASGEHQRVAPEIRLNLWLLFVARFPNDYARALQHLSDVIRYFQKHRVFNHENSPDLDQDVSQLIVELVTPSFSEQNDIWGLLRSAYQPSALYKIKMIVFRDEDGKRVTPVTELVRTITQEPEQ